MCGGRKIAPCFLLSAVLYMHSLIFRNYLPNSVNLKTEYDLSRWKGRLTALHFLIAIKEPANQIVNLPLRILFPGDPITVPIIIIYDTIYEWIGFRFVSYFDYGSGGQGFKPQSCQKLFLRCFNASTYKIIEMYLLAWKHLKKVKSIVHIYCDTICQTLMLAFTSRRHVPRHDFGEGRNQVRHVVVSQRRWMWVSKNIK